jgi:hypothetical protein
VHGARRRGHQGDPQNGQDARRDVNAVIKFAMDKAAEQAERSLCFVKAEACASADAMDRRGWLLDNDDLPKMTAKDLRDHFGTFLKVHAVYAENEAGATSMPSVTETVVLDVATQTDLTGDVVDIATAEAMIEEALCMVDEAEEGEHGAQKCAREWLDRAELGTALLRKAEERTDWAQKEGRAAQALAAAAQAARHMTEQMLAAEAALADAALESALDDCAARRQAEAQRDIYQALAHDLYEAHI